MSDGSSQKSGEDSTPLDGEGAEEKKGEDSWTDVSLNDDAEPRLARTDDKGESPTLI